MIAAAAPDAAPVRVDFRLDSPFLPYDRFQAICAGKAAAVAIERGWPSCGYRVLYKEHSLAGIEVLP